MSSDWQAFASNNVSVVVIDANHDYENVLSDARNSLRYFPSLQHLAGVSQTTWTLPYQTPGSALKP